MANVCFLASILRDSEVIFGGHKWGRKQSKKAFKKGPSWVVAQSQLKTFNGFTLYYSSNDIANRVGT